jgi:hypothetical protein
VATILLMVQIEAKLACERGRRSSSGADASVR